MHIIPDHITTTAVKKGINTRNNAERPIKNIKVSRACSKQGGSLTKIFPRNQASPLFRQGAQSQITRSPCMYYYCAVTPGTTKKHTNLEAPGHAWLDFVNTTNAETLEQTTS